MKKIISTISLVLLLFIASAQVDTKFTTSNFPGRASEVNAAKSNITKGNEFFNVGDYTNALKYYLSAQKFNPNNSDLNFKIGYCHFNSIQKSQCLEYFERAYKLNKTIDKKILFYLGCGYHWNYKFEDAKKCYSDYMKTLRDKNEQAQIRHLIQQCDNGIEIVKDTIDVEIINLGENINTEYREYCPHVTSDGSKLYFTSRRKGTTANSVHEDGLFCEDIYESTHTSAGWTKARNIGSPLNTGFNDAIVGLSPDGQTMYVYMDANGGDIYVSTLRGSKWQKPKSISEKINKASHETETCLSSDNKTLYFVSNINSQSLNDHDIYYSTLDKYGKWSAPVNIGEPINSEYDERGVFIHPDGRTLYFCSNGHNSMGGYDIFKSVRDEYDHWSEPENLGYPINTPLDDLFFSITTSGRNAYYTSARADGYGQWDLYEIKFPAKEQKQNAPKVLVTLVKGTITDADKNSPLEANIEITDNSKNEVISTFKSNSSSGAYIVNLPSGKNYGLSVSKDGYLFHSENFNLADTADFQELVIDVQLKKIQVGTTIILKNIFFDYNKSSLQPESYAELDRVAEILKKQPNLKIEISGHTDNQGSLKYNTDLSESRAKTVVDYLIGKGIAENRLTYKGYAYEKPIATNDTEEGRSANRRVEFKILETK
ncbi:MAG: PD40 domain-containing protein [Bacteroidales bacterium]|nr:PD40 domain-containing protein [Bacteroidales bacterium]